MGKLFGTDGVRGIANKELTPELAFRLGRAAGTLLKNKDKRTSIVLGKDTRVSGSMLEGALVAGICSAGVDVKLAGVIPTPAIAYLTRKEKAVAGVVISASHNAYYDNGIKFFNEQGYKLADELEEKIEELVLGDMENLPRPIGDNLGKSIPFNDARECYINFLKKQIDANFKGLKIVVDCANGAVCDVAPRVIRELGAQVISINDLPDGININEKCGSTSIQSLQDAVVQYKADLGIANDGDGDRVIAVDENGQEVNGDKILVICGLDLQQKGQLGNKVVVTVMSNMGLKKAFEKADIKVFESKVGDRYVLGKMLETDTLLGGEQSGHIIFLQHNTTGDGIMTALHLIKVVKESKRKLSDLAARMVNFPQVLYNVKVKSKANWEENTEINKAIIEGEKILGKNGRVLVRASGTEPLIRVMAEGEDKTQLEEIAGRIGNIIAKEQG